MWSYMTFNIMWSLKNIISCKCRIIQFLCCQVETKILYWFWIFLELQSDKLVKHLNTDWVFMSTLKACQNSGFWTVWTYIIVSSSNFSTHKYFSNQEDTFKFKYSPCSNMLEVWICQSNISHLFFKIDKRIKQMIDHKKLLPIVVFVVLHRCLTCALNFQIKK